MAAPTFVTITPINPPGAGAIFALLGDAKYAPAGNNSTGGWQIVDRPRLTAATQWYDRSPWQLDIPLMIDGQALFGDESFSFAFGQVVTSNVDIEDICVQVEQWLDRVPGTDQPPVLEISGPVPGIQHQWVVYQIEWQEALRDPDAGFRMQQKLQMTLYEYNSPTVAQSGISSPAVTAQQALNATEAGQTFSLWTVQAGQTLGAIAASALGNYNAWGEIAALNDIRDPNSIVVGQVLKIPLF